MSQSTTLGAVPNSTGALLRAAFNANHQAMATDHEGGVAPPVTYPFMRWRNDTAGRVHRRNASNTAWEIVENYRATADPAVSDDATAGYVRGAQWINTAAGRVFVCVNPAAGAAQWRQPATDIANITDLATWWRARLLSAPAAAIQSLLAADTPAAAQATLDAAAEEHTHSAADVTTGTLDGDRLPAISTDKRGGVPAYAPGDEAKVLTPQGWAPLAPSWGLADLPGLAGFWVAALAGDPSVAVQTLLAAVDAAAARAALAAAPATHAHDAGDLIAGTLDGDRLPAISTDKRGAVPPYTAGADDNRFLTPQGWADAPGGTTTTALADIGGLNAYWEASLASAPSAVIQALFAAAGDSDAREAIDAAPADHTHVAGDVTDVAPWWRTSRLLADPSAVVQALLGAADASAAQGALGVSTFVKTLLDDASAAAVLGTLGVSAYAQSLLDDADAAAARATLGLGTASTQAYGTAANQLVRLDASGKLPAVDGSNLTGIAAGGGGLSATTYYLARA
jgi:hypothetical protein